MKRVFIASFFVFSVLIVLPVSLCAQVKKYPSRAAMDSLLNPKLSPIANKILLFGNTKQDIGTVAESDSVRIVQFAFRNVSDKPITVSRVTTHCGCTVAEYPSEPVAAGETSVITIKYNPKGRYGTIDTNAFVYVDCAASHPVAKLTILGNVIDDNEWSHLPCAMGVLRLKRTNVAFGAGRTEVRIPCANTGDVPLKLSSRLLPEYATFATEPHLLQAGEEGDIVITVDAAKIGAAKQFTVLVDGVGGKISSRTIKAIIE